MKKLFSLLVILAVASLMVFTVSAESTVTYSGNSGSFVFAPGSENSPTDLFTSFKDVMPGDSLMQQITVKNNADNKVKVEIYLRSLGAHEDSAKFLSQLNLKVQKSEQNDMAYMFDAKADQTAGLTDWVCLGTLYSGGTVNLDLVLDVPVTLDNEFKNTVGYLDWEFMVKELPIEQDDPKPPQTGDNSHIELWVSLMAGSFILIIVLLFWRKKDKENKQNAQMH